LISCPRVALYSRLSAAAAAASLPIRRVAIDIFATPPID